MLNKYHKICDVYFFIMKHCNGIMITFMVDILKRKIGRVISKKEGCKYKVE